jgi:hypothetical protein
MRTLDEANESRADDALDLVHMEMTSWQIARAAALTCLADGDRP